MPKTLSETLIPQPRDEGSAAEVSVAEGRDAQWARKDNLVRTKLRCSKNLLPIGLCLVSAGWIGGRTVLATGQGGTGLFRASKTARAPQFQGNLGDWKSAGRVSFAGRSLGGHPRHATVYALWDAVNLYLAFDVHSSKLRAVVREHDGDKLWEDDGVEFLVDPGLHRTKSSTRSAAEGQFLPDDFSYHINILNTVYDDRGTPSGAPDPKWTGTARHAVKILDDYHYIVEVAVPWSESGLAPKAGTRIGIDFCVNGKDPATGEYDYFDWCGLKVFHDPSGFGELVLAGPRKH